MNQITIGVPDSTLGVNSLRQGIVSEKQLNILQWALYWEIDPDGYKVIQIDKEKAAKIFATWVFGVANSSTTPEDIKKMLTGFYSFLQSAELHANGTLAMQSWHTSYMQTAQKHNYGYKEFVFWPGREIYRTKLSSLPHIATTLLATFITKFRWKTRDEMMERTVSYNDCHYAILTPDDYTLLEDYEKNLFLLESLWLIINIGSWNYRLSDITLQSYLLLQLPERIRKYLLRADGNDIFVGESRAEEIWKWTHLEPIFQFEVEGILNTLTNLPIQQVNENGDIIAGIEDRRDVVAGLLWELDW